MAVTILGKNKIVKMGTLIIWPQDGFVCIEDAKDNSFKTISIKEALLRAQSLNDIIGSSKQLGEYRDQIDKLQNQVDGLIEVCKEAQAQDFKKREKLKAIKGT